MISKVIEGNNTFFFNEGDKMRGIVTQLDSNDN